MKRLVSLIAINLFLIYSQSVSGQIDADLTDLKTGKNTGFRYIDNIDGINKNAPTLLITWSGEFCLPCVELINRYNSCDLSMLNIITVNVDYEKDLDKVLAKGYHLKWNKSFNFHGNIGKKGGFDSVFNINNAPMLIFLDNKLILEIGFSPAAFPYLLVQNGFINDIKFIWNSPKDLNELAWSYYKNENDKDLLEKAKTWAIRSIELDKNYNNTDTLAALLYKTGNYTEALKMAKQAIEIAKINNTDYNTTTNLINQIIEKL
ncbi:tetratricopeptide repeat protein [Confluentibacter lentus]|uniref:tetratricopeptide repeat protein n=1 Tax=Confluentibacter lentus TaxID=1699412 RepID=UPI000C282043|nr:hypothetical protein [Confluentibacter lentus]